MLCSSSLSASPPIERRRRGGCRQSAHAGKALQKAKHCASLIVAFRLLLLLLLCQVRLPNGFGVAIRQIVADFFRVSQALQDGHFLRLFRFALVHLRNAVRRCMMLSSVFAVVAVTAAAFVMLLLRENGGHRVPVFFVILRHALYRVPFETARRPAMRRTAVRSCSSSSAAVVATTTTTGAAANVAIVRKRGQGLFGAAHLHELHDGSILELHIGKVPAVEPSLAFFALGNLLEVFNVNDRFRRCISKTDTSSGHGILVSVLVAVVVVRAIITGTRITIVGGSGPDRQ